MTDCLPHYIDGLLRSEEIVKKSRFAPWNTIIITIIIIIIIIIIKIMIIIIIIINIIIMV